MNFSAKMLRDNALSDKVIVVTGGGSGLGKAMTKYFLELGAQVAITSRDLEKCPTAVAVTQRAAVTPARQRELNLSELEVMTALEVVTEEYGDDRSRTFLVGHSMGSGGAWHLAARYPDRWRAVAPMSGPFVDVATYPFERIKKLPIFMTEGTGATPSLEGSRVMAKYMREGGFVFEYLEVDGNHGSMVGMVWPRVFEFFNRYK